MAREIKFRAWDDVMERMHYVGEENDIVFELTCEGFVAVDITEDEDEFATLHHLKYMQYAELNDKDGTPIFDGDVIYWEIDNGVGIESYTAVVCWSEDLVEEGWNETYKWLVKYVTDYLRGGFDELCLPAAYNSELRVIGNIYENPELLEVEG